MTKIKCYVLWRRRTSCRAGRAESRVHSQLLILRHGRCSMITEGGRKRAFEKAKRMTEAVMLGAGNVFELFGKH